MKLKYLFGVIPLVMTWPTMLGQVPVKNPLHKTPSRPGAPYLTAFDPKTVQTIEGTVSRVYTVPSTKLWLTSVQLLVRTANGDVHVNLGPTWFVDNQELRISAEDVISVTGSRVKPKGIDTMIATEVKRGEEVLSLRTADGMPVWSAWRWPPRAESESTASRSKVDGPLPSASAH